MKLSDRVVCMVQSAVQGDEIATATLREALALNRQQVGAVRQLLASEKALLALGIEVMNVVIASIAPSAETARALEADAREAILQGADDAIYARRKSAVEQERIIKEAELQTELSVQQKEQEIEESRIRNEREILRGQTETERDRLQATDRGGEPAQAVCRAECGKRQADRRCRSVCHLSAAEGLHGTAGGESESDGHGPTCSPTS